MQVSKVKLHNYRNLDGIVVELDHELNFIVGENNIGKSNFQSALAHVLACQNFDKEDFMDDELALQIEFRFHLDDDEIGIFDDLTDPMDNHYINIIAIQEDPDDGIQFRHLETGDSISRSLIRQLNVVAYDSIRNPKNEIDFSKSRGAGAFLNYLVNSYFNSNSEKHYFNTEEINKLEEHLAHSLEGISAFNRFNLKAVVDEDNIDIISKIVTLRDDNNINVPDNGYGVQYNLMIILSLLEKIIRFSKNKKNEEDIFSAVLIFDEPEIHLHPYLQRTIIKDISRLAKGEDQNFNKLLEEQFGIRKINAQIIIATHSPNMISGNYNQIIRFYQKGGKTEAISGKNIQFEGTEKKQLMMQFEYFKEAIFAKAAIVVEGVSEYGSFPGFAQSLGVDFDQQGIAIINADGAESIFPIIGMLGKFGIRAVGVVDKDKKDEKNFPEAEYLFYTSTKCFDSEIVINSIINGNIEALRNLICTYDCNGLERGFQQGALQKTAKKFGYTDVNVSKAYKFSDTEIPDRIIEILYIQWFATNKGILLGKLIGQSLSAEEIPSCYVNAINKVTEYTR